MTQNPALSFALGTVVATRSALIAVPYPEILRALARHASGDWGDADPALNESALRHDERLFSHHAASDGTELFVITEWDRSVTTVLLPADY